MTAVRVLSFVVSGSFLLLFAMIVRDAARVRDRARLAMVIATAWLAVVTILSRVADVTDYQYRVISDLTIVAFLVSGYGFLLVRDAFVPLPRGVRAGALGVVVATIVLDMVAQLPTQPQTRYSGLQVVAIVAFVGVWVACVAEPAWKLWRAGRDVPVVQRARLRAMSAGLAGIIGILVATLAVAPPQRHPLGVLLIQIASLLVIVFMYMGLVPPRWLRRVWREPEEEEYRRSVEDIILSTSDRSELGTRAAEWAVRLVGGGSGVVVGADGAELGAVGDPSDEVRRLAASVDPSAASSVVELESSRVIVVPLRMKTGDGALAVESAPFTPVFGSDELSRLTQYAATLGAAIDRVGLVEQLGRRTAQYETLLRGVSDLGEGFILLEGMTVVYVNEAYTRISGYTLDELKHLSLVDMTVPEDRDRIIEMGLKRRSGEPVPDHYETAMIRRDGRRVDVEVSVKMLAGDGSVPQVFSLVRDITERKKAERELARMDEERRAFIANAAHELRTPLTVVTGIAAALTGQRHAMSEDLLTESFAALGRQVERIRVLIDNLLDLSQIEQGRMAVDLQPVDLRAAAQRAIEGAPPPAGVRCRVTVRENTMVLADPHRLDQVLVNFLTNAYRYGGPTVTLEAVEAGDAIVVTIADDGPGVPDELVPNLFDPFTRGPEVRRVQGSGLGLAIVRRLIEAFGGDVWYEQGAPQGARFHVRLPRAAKAGAGAA